MIINIFFTDDPVCPCCNEHMEEGVYWKDEEVGVLSNDDFYCPSCGYVALNGVDIKHKSEIENE